MCKINMSLLVFNSQVFLAEAKSLNRVLDNLSHSLQY